MPFGSPLQNIEAFERRDLAADQAEHLTLVLYKTQRSEIAGALGVVGVLCRQAKPLMQNAGLVRCISTWSLATREPSSIVSRRSRRPMTFFWSKNGIEASVGPRSVSCTSELSRFFGLRVAGGLRN